VVLVAAHHLDVHGEERDRQPSSRGSPGAEATTRQDPRPGFHAVRSPCRRCRPQSKPFFELNMSPDRICGPAEDLAPLRVEWLRLRGRGSCRRSGPGCRPREEAALRERRRDRPDVGQRRRSARRSGTSTSTRSGWTASAPLRSGKAPPSSRPRAGRVDEPDLPASPGGQFLREARERF
jgi:hypothetical protein